MKNFGATALVLYTVGPTHVPRPEEWPIMPEGGEKQGWTERVAR